MNSEQAPGDSKTRTEAKATSSRSRSSNRWSKRFKILRILRKDRPFAVVLALGVLLGGGVLLGVPKIWRVTPEGFPMGVVRVSLVDRLQAWSLMRTARRAEAAGMDEAAMFAWRGAMVNNPGNPTVHRGFLRFLAATPAALTERTMQAVQSGTWLLALAKTNTVDLELAAGVVERYGRPRLALAWMERAAAGKSESLDRVRARCLLSSARFDLFESLWREHESRWASDPISRTYHDAWVAATDDRTAGLSATVRLKDTMSEAGETGLVAARLLLMSAAVKGQVDDVGLALAKLAERGSASAAQHGFYWRTLASSGRRAEAKQLAESYDKVSVDPEAAASHWRAMWEVGATNALTWMESQIGRYGNDIEAWRTYFDLLAGAEKWREMARGAANARLLCSRLEPLYVETMFAEYRVARGESRSADVKKWSEELAAQTVGDGEGLVRIAAALRTGGNLPEALRLIGKHESTFREWPGYWAEAFSVGLSAKDFDLLRRSVSEMVRIEPKSVAWVNNRAALLLITGEDPAEALRLTLEGLARQPTSSTLRINHAMALTANGRASEAESILRSIPFARLPSEGVANFHLAMAEAQAALGRPIEAVASARRAETRHLLSPQIERLERILGRSGAGTGPVRQE